MIQALAFYLFATLVIASGALTVMARNPVHSVLWLILAFFNGAGLMLLTGAEFLAFLLIIVYVGAVAVDDLIDHMLPEDWRGDQMDGTDDGALDALGTGEVSGG